MRRRGRSAKPTRSKSELVELAVETLGAQGDGIAHWRGEPVFLPFTVPGDRVRAEIGARRGAGHEGQTLERIAAGPRRAEPICGHFGRCGGCALQHLVPEDYRAAKLDALKTALRRVGIDPEVVGDLVAVPPARRRVRLGMMRPRDPKAPAVIGFRERFRHVLVDLRECPVPRVSPELFARVEPMRRIAPALLPPGGAAEAMLTRAATAGSIC